MPVPVRWLLAQRDLGLVLRGGDGLDRAIGLALTTELAEPYPWLSGRELVLTTGLGLPASTSGRADYLRGLDGCGIAGVGFGTGLTHPRVPADLIAAADEIGLPLIEVPLRTPFAAVITRVSARLAELQYDAVLHASRAQPKMTRAVLTGGAPALVAELSVSLRATVLLLDPSARLVHAHPAAPPEGLGDRIAELLAAEGDSMGFAVQQGGRSIAAQRIGIGRRSPGYLVVLGGGPLDPIAQILLGHANSLLALDFEKPQRLRAEQRALNTRALELALDPATDAAFASVHLADATDADGRIRVLVVDRVPGPVLSEVTGAIRESVRRDDFPSFIHAAGGRVTVVVPAADSAGFGERIAAAIPTAARRSVRIGVSRAHRVIEFARAADGAASAAAAAEPGGRPTEFTDIAGRALFASDAGRQLLDLLADNLLGPLAESDRDRHTDLVPSLRAYLESNGHWESAAADLGVHRHTLRKRMTQVQELLGVDLGVARVRAELLLALLARTP
ncbi:PucR family transcriptional regulator [Nocardia alni]|uniref:PucR family transcriptional regulator n=1 Tax=Nocardia alni TaxID=2815723 RepID=UPI001C21E53C|nr:PucR family transcriptional regulator [Nocardia alni]